MPSNAPGAEPSPRPARLLLVFCERSEREVRRILSRLAHPGWEQEGTIRLLAIRDNFWRFRPANSDAINACAPKQHAARVVLLDRIEHNERFGEGRDLRALNTFVDLRSFGSGLSSILLQSGLDWRSFIIQRISTWYHGTVNEQRVEAWLDQFRRLGVPWIGEYILRTLDFWDADRLMHALDLNAALLTNFDCICLKRNEPGKSGDFLSSLLRKRINEFCRDFPILDFLETFRAAESEPKPERILFIEDTLLTGTETTNFLSALLGVPNPWRPWTLEKLDRPEELRNHKIEFRFPVSTSLGKHRLQSFLTQQRLANARFHCSVVGFNEVLTDAGQAALENNTFLAQDISNCPSDPDLHLDRPAFWGPWKKASQLHELETFCREVGRPLFAQYIRLKGHEWPERKLATCDLGMFSLGLNLAFTHSVPKSSLPVLWSEGTIRYNGSTLSWMPLFPNAAS